MIKSFTLLELLVVIGIIGMLAALTLPNFMAARERARDAQRKSDLKQIQKALELYKQDQATPDYPADDTFLANPGDAWTSGPPLNTIYMSKVPGDSSRSPTKYFYQRTAQLEYTLCACLENKADPDGVAGDCAAGYTCGGNPRRYIVNEP